MKSFLWKSFLFFLIINLFSTFFHIFLLFLFLFLLAPLIYLLTALGLSANIISCIGMILVLEVSIIYAFMVCRMVWKILPKEMVE